MQQTAEDWKSTRMYIGTKEERKGRKKGEKVPSGWVDG